MNLAEYWYCELCRLYVKDEDENLVTQHLGNSTHQILDTYPIISDTFNKKFKNFNLVLERISTISKHSSSLKKIPKRGNNIHQDLKEFFKAIHQGKNIENVVPKNLNNKKPTQKTSIICGICRKAFKNTKLLKIHSSSVEACSICDKKICPSQSLKHHIKEAHGPGHVKIEEIYEIDDDEDDQNVELFSKKIECEFCVKKFTAIEDFDVHIKTEHSIVCKFCKKAFGTLKEKDTHIEIVHVNPKEKQSNLSNKKNINNEKENQVYDLHDEQKVCINCGRNFATKGTLNNHIKTFHTDSEMFYCEYCGKSFREKGNRKQHTLIVHKGIKKSKKYICYLCGKSFSQKSILPKHIRYVHNGIKDFKCPHCPKEFAEKCSMETHIKIVHRGLKEFKCLECNKYFGEKGNLKQHININHEGIKKYKCSRCENLGFGSSSALKYHFKIVHEGVKNFKCTLCDDAFVGKMDLVKHTNIIHKGMKQYDCNDCNKIFSSYIGIRKHVQSVHCAEI